MKRTKLLLVDDEVGQRQMLAGYLEKNGFAVEQASSGEEGLELYRSFFPPVAVVDFTNQEEAWIHFKGCRKVFIHQHQTLREVIPCRIA